ncbi:hypothetical protein AOQ84DRAFT_353352 [Glonium stellatum]|uniref:Uncharacterized protein n=1 Tax=Glonium stellatum TaxID=574774 RepID=A0A8E2JVA2_9PEZI|nr:hypothetical protein AOQ84DRAFT_353352 [Glonium stellatum]
METVFSVEFSDIIRPLYGHFMKCSCPTLGQTPFSNAGDLTYHPWVLAENRK